MEQFYKSTMTEKGFQHMAKQQLGLPPVVTRAEAGEGFVPESELSKQTKVLNPIGEMAIGTREIVDNVVVRTPLQITNQDLQSTAMIRQVGVYVEDPDEGEILYQIVQYSVPQPLPSQTASRGSIATFESEIDLFFANSDNAVIETNPSFLLRPSDLERYYTREQVDAFLAKKADLTGADFGWLKVESAVVATTTSPSENPFPFAAGIEPLANGWGNTYSKDQFGKVHINTSGVKIDGNFEYGKVVIGTMPVTHRPPKSIAVRMTYWVGKPTASPLSNTTVFGEISASGQVTAYMPDNPSYNAISFSASYHAQ